MTTPRVVVGIVTRQRTGLLQQCMNSAVINAGNADVSVVAMFDDDREGADLIPDYPWLTKLVSPHRVYYVRAANELCRFILKHDPDYFCIIDDDTEFIQPPWAEVCIQWLQHIAPGGFGMLDLLSYKECCHIFTTPTFVRDFLGGELYDTRYLQFYHDSALRYKVEAHFGHINDIKGRPFFVHKRDFLNGAAGALSDVKGLDRRTFRAQAKEHGWSVFGEDLRPQEETPAP